MTSFRHSSGERWPIQTETAGAHPGYDTSSHVPPQYFQKACTCTIRVLTRSHVSCRYSMFNLILWFFIDLSRWENSRKIFHKGSVIRGSNENNNCSSREQLHNPIRSQSSQFNIKVKDFTKTKIYFTWAHVRTLHGHIRISFERIESFWGYSKRWNYSHIIFYFQSRSCEVPNRGCAIG